MGARRGRRICNVGGIRNPVRELRVCVIRRVHARDRLGSGEKTENEGEE